MGFSQNGRRMSHKRELPVSQIGASLHIPGFRVVFFWVIVENHFALL